MPLPRPARILRQCQTTSNRHMKLRSIHVSSIIRDEHTTSDETKGQEETGLVEIKPRGRRRMRNLKPIPQNIVETELHSISSKIGDIELETRNLPRSPFGLVKEEIVYEEDDGPKEARNSPAALLGSKRLELALLPTELIVGIEDAIDEVDSKMVRQHYIRLHEQSLKPPESRKKPRIIEPEMAVAAAAAFLPGEYAAVRNVLEEMDRRLGRDWLEKAAKESRQTHLAQEKEDGIVSMIPGYEDEGAVRPRVLEASSGLGPGLWAMMDSRGLLDSTKAEGMRTRGGVDFELFHGPRHTKKMANKLAKAIPEDAASLHFPPTLDKNFISTTPALTMSTFYLSSLKENSRRKHVKMLLDFKSPYTIIVDHARKGGWDAISMAREYILSLSTPENPLHMVAPCPHDAACPLKDSRDMCGFSQRHASPSFMRRTKHSKKGQEDKRYVYLVIGRGERPVPLTTGGDMWAIGRMGGVAKDQARKEIERVQGKSVMREVEGSESGQVQYEMVPLKDVEKAERQANGEDEPVDFANADEGEMLAFLREEAYSWPRLVAPPIKASGHIIMDVCHQTGDIARMTIPKSHSKQGYHDARKSHWGDIFPHEPKNGKVIVRSRGLKRLSPVSEVENDEDAGAFWDDLLDAEEGSSAEEMALLRADPEVQYTTGDTRRGRKSLSDKKAMIRDEKIRLDKKERSIKLSDYDDYLSSVPKNTTHSDGVTGFGMKKQGKGEHRSAMNEAEDMGNDDDGFGRTWESGTSTETTGRRGRSAQSNLQTKRFFGTLTRPMVGLESAKSFTQRRHMSVRPPERIGRAKVTIAELNRMKSAGTPITVLTAYDFPTSLLSESAGVDMVLVGDSLSQVALGHETTTSITLEEMIHHCKAVTRGAKTAFVFADLPFGSFESSTEKGMESTIRMIKEGGIDGVKIEGGREILPLVERLFNAGIAVIPHLGLQPQRATSTSGYLVQGRSSSEAENLMQTAMLMEEAGAIAVLLEAIPHVLAKHITNKLTIPTIGIGAGPDTSGQVLVITDVLGTYAPDPDLEESGSREGRPGQPKFVRQFGNVGRESRRAVDEYIKCVRDRSFPEVGKETYVMKKDQWEDFLKSQGEDK